MTDEENFDDAAKRRAEDSAPGEGAGAEPQQQKPTAQGAENAEQNPLWPQPDPNATPENATPQQQPQQSSAGPDASTPSDAPQHADSHGPHAQPETNEPQAPQAGPFPPNGPAMGGHPGAYGQPGPQANPPTGQMPLVQPPMAGPAGSPPTQQYPHPPQSKSMSSTGKAVLALVIAGVLALGSGLVGGFVGFSLANGAGANAQSSPSDLASDSTLTEVAAAVQPSVVSISAGQAEGSGVVYNSDGYIITNNHVADGAQNGQIEVAFANGDSAAADIVGTDPAGDLAVLKVDGVSDLQPIEFGDSDGLAVGDTVLALGSPLGLDGSVSSGIVSALDRTIQAGGQEQPGAEGTTLNGLIQTDAAINPGNSGGALVNGNGELIGINTAIATTGESQGSVGVGFAIPSSTVEPTVEELIENGGVERGFLGVSVTDAVGGDEEGAIVTTVQEGSPADDAGLSRGDIITSIDDTDVTSASDVVSAVQNAEPGSKVSVEFITSDGDQDSVEVTLGSTTD